MEDSSGSADTAAALQDHKARRGTTRTCAPAGTDAVQMHLECWQKVMRGVFLLRAASKNLLLLLRHGPLISTADSRS